MTTSILDTYFNEHTMSVHIQAWQQLLSKIWKPGGWSLVHEDRIRTRSEVAELLNTLYVEIAARDDAFVEIERSASKVLQLGAYRIVIVHEPVANGMEITVVRPVAKLKLEEYTLPEDITQRLIHDAQGILIAGSPWEWKTTFAQALIEEIAKKEVIIKTIESPRDLVVPKSITQYSSSHAPHDEIRDILLLSRPDYSVYDEVRNTADFHLYKDLRLTWIWLVWVMHATQAVDAIQRFISAVDMWTVPQVIDTVVFIKAGKVQEVLGIEQVVRTPAGMRSEDLARPLIEVSSLLHNTVLYEIYSYGDNVVVMPLDKVNSWSQDPWPLEKYAKRAIEQHMQELIEYRCHIEITGSQSLTMYVPDSIKWRVIGKQWKRIDEIQKITWFNISVRSPVEMNIWSQKSIPYTIHETQKNKKTKIEIVLPENYTHTEVKIMIWWQLMHFNANHEHTVTIRRKKLVDLILQWDIHIIW